MKHIFIVNENAHNKKTNGRVELIKSASKALGLDAKVIATKSINDAKRACKKYKNDKDAIVYAVGGDGSINVVLNEIVNGKCTFGIVPMGTGNDFYRTLNSYEEDLITSNVIKVNDRYCINIFSTGIDAEICLNVAKMEKIHLPDKLLYYGSIVYTLCKHKHQFMNITLDKKKYEQYITLIAVCNGRYYGNGFKMSPSSDITDKKVDTYKVNGIKLIAMIKFLLKVLKGTHMDHKDLEIVNAKHIVITSLEKMVGNIDGEVVKTNKFDIDTNAATIKIYNNRELIKLLNLKSK